MKQNALAIFAAVVAVAALLVSLKNFSEVRSVENSVAGQARILEVHGGELGNHASAIEKLKSRP